MAGNGASFGSPGLPEIAGYGGILLIRDFVIYDFVFYGRQAMTGGMIRPGEHSQRFPADTVPPASCRGFCLKTRHSQSAQCLNAI